MNSYYQSTGLDTMEYILNKLEMHALELQKRTNTPKAKKEKKPVELGSMLN